MTTFPRWLCHLRQLAGMLLTRLVDALRSAGLCRRSPAVLAAEHLFLQKQLSLYRERHVTPRRAARVTCIALVWLGRWFDWRQALTVGQPATCIRWHRQGFPLFWWWTSRPGRPPIPAHRQALIRGMARDHPTSGEERIANEWFRKLGLRVSPRTVRTYLPTYLAHGWQRCVPSQRWLILGLRVLKTPARSPQANRLCGRLLGTLRRACLDFLIPLTEHHLRRLVNEWVPHDNVGRPHLALGPGISQPPPGLSVPLHGHRHRMPEHLRVVARPILGRLHHAYRLEERAA